MDQLSDVVWEVGLWAAGAGFVWLEIRKALADKWGDARNFKPDNVLGGAHFATEKEMKKAGMFGSEGIPIGFTQDGKRALFYNGQSHILNVAAARKGKGLLLIWTLLTVKRSVVCVDPKVENAMVTARFRLRFGKVYVLNPFGQFADKLEGLLARYNPMDMLDASSEWFHAMCDKLAASIVWDEGSKDRHWTVAARILVSGVIAALVRHGKESERNLAMVAQIISGDVYNFCRDVIAKTKDPFLVTKLSRFAVHGAESNKEITDVICTAIVQLGFIGNASIAKSLSGKSSFRFRDLSRECATVYICLPLGLLDVSDKYFRLIMECALTELLNEGGNG